MKKITFLTFVMLLAVQGMTAANFSKKAAQLKAQQVADATGQQVIIEQTPAHTAYCENGEPAFYAFNALGGKGFVIVAGEDEVLAYSDEGQFSIEAMPTAMQAMLEAYVGACNAGQKALLPQQPSRAEVEPLIKTNWGQGDPYYNLCPVNVIEIGSNVYRSRCNTGCIATAMAQIMRYHEWPKANTEEVPSFSPEDNYEDFMFDPLPPTTFNWSIMKNEYEKGEEGASINEVAKLMQYCGYAARMDYGPGDNASTANDGYMIYPLVTYFDYDPGMHFVLPSDYSFTEWVDILYQEIAAARPVMISGRTTDNYGHAFILDGFKDGYFHVNWGYGHSNGYFKTYALTVGNGTNAKDYSNQQKAVVGIQPNKHEQATTNPMKPFCLKLSNNTNNYVVAETWHYDIRPMRFGVAIGEIDDETGEIKFVRAVQTTTLPTMNAEGVITSQGKNLGLAYRNLGFKNGTTHRLVPLYCVAKDDKESPNNDSYDWVSYAPYGTSLELTLDDSGTPSFKLITPDADLKAEDFVFSAQPMLNTSVTVTANIANYAIGNFDGKISFVLRQGSSTRTLQQFTKMVPAGEYLSVKFSFTPNTLGEAELFVRDETTKNEIGSVKFEVADPAGIDDAKFSLSNDNKFYQLDGRTSNTPANGINIHQGKKTIYK